MKYELVVEATYEKLEQEVNRMINYRGFIPIGGVTVAEDVYLVQAMIKTEEK